MKSRSHLTVAAFSVAFSISTTVFALANESVADIAKRTLTCHNSFKKHTAPDKYEVFEKDDLIFARSIDSDPRVDGKDGKTYLQLSFTDGSKVFSARVESPSYTDKKGEQRQRFYYQDHSFKLNFPNGKSYCVVMQPRLGADQLKKYEAAPPATCTNEIAAIEQKDAEAKKHLNLIHTRLGDGINIAVHLSERCKTGNYCDRARPEEKLVGFTGAECRGIDWIKGDLKRFEAYASKHGNSLREGVAGEGSANSADGVQ